MNDAGVVVRPEFMGTASLNTVNQTLAADNSFGIGFIDSTNSLVSQTAVYLTFSYSFGYYFNGTSNNKFTNNLITSNSISANMCSVTGGANVGVVNGTCANQGLSDAAKTNYDEMTATSPIVGEINANDILNSSDSGTGTAIANTITDFLNFESRFRAWGKTALDTGVCSGVNNCSILDLRLKATDTVFRNTSDDGVTQNAAFAANTTCPAAVHGNRSLTDQSDTIQTFLINAQEIINDGLGDEDGLCESTESCIYSPNFGAYQGHGDYKAAGTCTFQNGTVSDVKMYSYPINGI